MAEDVLQRRAIRLQVEGCRNCSLHAVGSGPIPFRGLRSPRLAVVGEAPGKEEDVARAPFVGPSGRLIHASLSRHLPDVESDVAFLNVVSCYPNRTPSDREVAACAPNLRSQLQYLQPRQVLILGGVSLGYWWQQVRMGEVRGRLFTWTHEDAQVPALATWHPAAVLRNRSLYGEFEKDIAKILRCQDNTLDDTCCKCGFPADEFLSPDGTLVTTTPGAFGYGFCRKHYDQRVGVAGTGQTVPKRTRVKKEPVVQLFGLREK